jgi:hypothetical protein
MKKNTSFIMALVFGFSLFAVSAFAKDTLDAESQKAGQITSPTKAGSFTIIGTSDKGVTIEPMDKNRTAKDKTVFKARIKLNGSGGADARAVSVSVKQKAKVTVYLSSGSKTEERILLVSDKDGNVAGEITAPGEDDATAWVGTVEIAKAGEYFIFSKKSGINIYKIVVE